MHGLYKELEYEEALALAKRKMNEEIFIPVKLEKEPHNPVDAKVIAFLINVDSTWRRISYVINELLEEVHKAMDDGLIMNIQVDCIKYIPYFKYPGWYAGIKFTKNGDWSEIVIRKCSTL